MVDVLVGGASPSEVGVVVTATDSDGESPTTSGCGSELALHAVNNNRVAREAKITARVRTEKNCTDILQLDGAP